MVVPSAETDFISDFRRQTYHLHLHFTFSNDLCITFPRWREVLEKMLPSGSALLKKKTSKKLTLNISDSSTNTTESRPDIVHSGLDIIAAIGNEAKVLEPSGTSLEPATTKLELDPVVTGKTEPVTSKIPDDEGKFEKKESGIVKHPEEPRRTRSNSGNVPASRDSSLGDAMETRSLLVDTSSPIFATAVSETSNAGEDATKEKEIPEKRPSNALSADGQVIKKTDEDEVSQYTLLTYPLFLRQVCNGILLYNQKS